MFAITTSATHLDARHGGLRRLCCNTRVHLVVLHCLLMGNTDTKTTPHQKRTAAKRKEPRPQPHTSLRAKHCGGLTCFSSTYFRTLQPYFVIRPLGMQRRYPIIPTYSYATFVLRCNSRSQCVAFRLDGFLGDLLSEKAGEHADGGRVAEECIG